VSSRGNPERKKTMTINFTTIKIEENNNTETVGCFDVTNATEEELADLLGVDVEEDVDSLRKEYGEIMARSEQTAEIFNVAVKRALNGKENLSPRDYVNAAKRVSFRCERCSGSGQYTTMVINGRPAGPGGKCYRCQGKGTQNDADRRRNYGYDNFALVKEFRAMMRQ
jgi:hypothetical protein